MRCIQVLAVAAFALIALPAAAASLNTRDANYLKTSIQVQLGRYAMADYEVRHGSGAAKKFAKSIAAQSAHDSRRLESLAKHYGVTPAKGLLIQDKFHYSELQGLSGSALDKKFAREMGISDDINRYTDKQEMKSGQNATLKSYASHRYAAIVHELAALKHL